MNSILSSIWLFILPNIIFAATTTRPRGKTNQLLENSLRIVKNQCTVYAKQRYVTTTYESMVPYERPVIRHELDCFQNEPLLSHGVSARPKEFPHMVAIGYPSHDPKIQNWNCGGSLISDRYVLSAAHCSMESGQYNATWARLGVLKKNSPTQHTYKIIERIAHPKYSPNQKYNDIALFKLNASVTFSPAVRPICLYPMTGEPMAATPVIITGWGQECAGCVDSDVLLMARISIMSDKECSTSYPVDENHGIPFGFEAQTMICAFDKINGSDTCPGDSGGPLQVNIPNEACMYYQMGVTSFGGPMCGIKGFPTIYTQITPYIPWIQSIVWPQRN